MEKRNYQAPKTEDIISAIEILFSSKAMWKLNGLNYPYTKDLTTECSFFNGTNNIRYIVSKNEGLYFYCSFFIFNDKRFYFGSTNNKFCDGVNFDEQLDLDFKKSKNNQKRIYTALNKFKEAQSVKSAKNLLSLYQISFDFGKSGDWINTNTTSVKYCTIPEEKPIKTIKNKVKDELSILYKEYRQKTKELECLKEKIESKQAELENL